MPRKMSSDQFCQSDDFRNNGGVRELGEWGVSGTRKDGKVNTFAQLRKLKFGRP